MLEEYKQIYNAFSDLYPQKDQLLKFYLTLITIGSTILGTLLLLQADQLGGIGITNIYLNLTQVIGLVFGILSIVGIFTLLSAIGNRIEMLHYARAINCIRRYFADNYPDIKNYLVLPIHDEKPPFFEKINRPFIQEVFILAILNSILIATGLTLIFNLSTNKYVIQLIVVIVSFAFQFVIFWWICNKREKEYTTKCPILEEK